jgi:hypothetical protein
MLKEKLIKHESNSHGFRNNSEYFYIFVDNSKPFDPSKNKNPAKLKKGKIFLLKILKKLKKKKT